jgi:LmbE family N-acetylglucosaminyl deacetylase
MSAVMREPLIDDRGATPEWAWRPWLQTLADALPNRDTSPLTEARLVVVSPHPDDEVLGCGGLLALHAAAGNECLLVAATDGEASHRPLLAPSSAALAAQRRAESVAGLQQLMVRTPDVLRLGMPDGNVARHEQYLVNRLVRTLRRGDSVVVTWRLDGHPDHEACGRATAMACERAGCRLLEMPIWMWHWSTPGDTRVPWHRLVALPLPAAVQKRKRQALAAHESQWRPRGASTAPVLDDAMVARMQRPHEYYFV